MERNQLRNKIERLVEMRSNEILKGHDVDDLNKSISKLESKYNQMLLEDTSATGGPAGAVTGGAVSGSGVAMANASIAGMGAVVSPQASSFSGSTTGQSFTAGGGTVGSGDVSVPFPVGGRNPMYQKMEMGKSHGARTGKKSRQKRLSINQLKDIFAKKQDYTTGAEKKAQKVMNWDNFQKNSVTQIKRLKY